MKYSSAVLLALSFFAYARADADTDSDVDTSADADVTSDTDARFGNPRFPGGDTYRLSHNLVGRDFYRFFDYETFVGSEPTHGRVNYVSESVARAKNLTYASHDTFVLRTDYRSGVLDPEGPGRDSVRLLSKQRFTQHVAIFDVRHMPEGCGTWPAIWEKKAENWPTGGEVDIVEGVNNQSPNAATLHTVTGCTMPPDGPGRPQSGTAGQLDCDWLVNWNTGCTVKMKSPLSFGPAFNNNGGGWFALERSRRHIKVWFWPRNARHVPPEVRHGWGANHVRPSTWGLPDAYFPDTQCDLEKYFSENNLIINLTLCGDWAGNPDVYAAAGCPGTCVDHVNNNPDAFRNAYFDFASIRIYE